LFRVEWWKMAQIDRKNRDAMQFVALASGAGVREAAEQAGVAERTVYHRLQDTEFLRQVRSARGTMLSGVIEYAASLATGHGPEVMTRFMQGV